MKNIFFAIVLLFSTNVYSQTADVTVKTNVPVGPSSLQLFVNPSLPVGSEISQIVFTISTSNTCAAYLGSPSTTTGVSISADGPHVSGSTTYISYSLRGSWTSFTNGIDNLFATIPITNGPGTAGTTCSFIGQTTYGANGNFYIENGTNGAVQRNIINNAVNVVLPVEITSFTAIKDGTKTNLQWETTKEKNLSVYSIERSGDAVSFSSIGTEKPRATSQAEITTYKFTDESPLFGVNYYRILAKDVNGDFDFSKVVSVAFPNGGSDFKVSPNPAKTGAQLNILTTWAKEYDFKITDMSGRLIFQQLKLHSQNVEINGLDLATGSYIYECKTVNSNSTGKLIITN